MLLGCLDWVAALLCLADKVLLSMCDGVVSSSVAAMTFSCFFVFLCLWWQLHHRLLSPGVKRHISKDIIHTAFFICRLQIISPFIVCCDVPCKLVNFLTRELVQILFHSPDKLFACFKHDVSRYDDRNVWFLWMDLDSPLVPAITTPVVMAPCLDLVVQYSPERICSLQWSSQNRSRTSLQNLLWVPEFGTTVAK